MSQSANHKKLGLKRLAANIGIKELTSEEYHELTWTIHVHNDAYDAFVESLKTIIHLDYGSKCLKLI